MGSELILLVKVPVTICLSMSLRVNEGPFRCMWSQLQCDVSGCLQSDPDADPTAADVKTTMLLPLDTGEKPTATIEETAEIDTLTAAASEDVNSPAAIPEPITQTVVSSETGGVNSYGQLLQAGLSHGGLQPSEIPQVQNNTILRLCLQVMSKSS